MKNTTFRKKALLSSVAMLLVALVALGSATFAWFSSNREVNANTMVVKAAAAQGLQISNNNGADWSNEVSFSQSTNQAVLSPVSFPLSNAATSIPAEGFYPLEVKTKGGDVLTSSNASAFNGWAKESWKAPSQASGDISFVKSDNGYFATYDVLIRSSGSAINNVTGKIEYVNVENENVPDAVASDYVRMALINVSNNNEVLDVFGNEQDATETTKDITPVIGSISDANPATATLLSGGVETTRFTPGANNFNTFANASLTAPAAGGYTRIRLIVWFEGQDEQCKDDMQQAIGQMKLVFSY